VLTCPLSIGWTVAAVANTEFEKRTTDVGQITVLKCNHRPQKNELEFCFEVSEPTAIATPAATQQIPAKKPLSKYANTMTVAKELVESFISSLDKAAGIKLTEEQQEAIRKALVMKTEATLNLVKNNAYATGFAAHLSK
jgi:hypothetical protein